MMRSLVIDGKRFQISVRKQPPGNSWQWVITAPGQLVLAGEAPSEMQALQSACRAGRTLAKHNVAA